MTLENSDQSYLLRKKYLFIFLLFSGDITEGEERSAHQCDPRVSYDLIEGHLPPPGLPATHHRGHHQSNTIR